MISVAEARNIIASNVEKGRVASVLIIDAVGYILADDMFSLCDVPSFDNSAMDGYAFKYDGTHSFYKIAGNINAGIKQLNPLDKGETAAIYTGAPVPEGADTVIQNELADVAGDLLRIDPAKVEVGMNIRRRGAQCRAGDRIAVSGSKITPGMVGLLASVGINNVRVYMPPVVGIVTTGNELTDAGSSLEKYQVYNSNGPALIAALRQLGVKDILYEHAIDDAGSMAKKIESFLDRCDIVILTGGISAGAYDFVRGCLNIARVEQLFYKVKQKPGKPLFVGKKGRKWVFALPGNPAAVLTCFVQYVRQCINSIMGMKDAWAPSCVMPLEGNCHKKSGLTFFSKARVSNGYVKVLAGDESFNLLPFAEANGIVELPEEAEYVESGTLVKVYEC